MQEHSYEHNTDQKVDLELIFRNFLHVLKRTWWWVTLLAILVGALRYVQAQSSPVYSHSLFLGEKRVRGHHRFGGQHPVL